MDTTWLLPACVVFPLIGSAIIWIVGRKKETLRDNLAWAFVVLQLILMIGTVILNNSIGECLFKVQNFSGIGITFSLTGLQVIFVILCAFSWFVSTVCSKDYLKNGKNKNRYYVFLFLTFSATLGVFLSADLFTTFLFFEMMSFTSYVWVVHEESKEAMRAGETYLAIAVLGGMVMLMGIFLLYYHMGTLSYEILFEKIDKIRNTNWNRIAAVCIFFGFAAKAGTFPLHIWLPKAHPVAPAPTSALLSGILTKTGIFGILLLATTIMAGDKKFGWLLLILGTLTMMIGGILALFSINLKKVLACSSVSQIGFIIIGIGALTLLRTDGILAGAGIIIYIVNHALFKILLFNCAGIVYTNVHSLELNEIRGFGYNKPFFKLIFLSGACGISGLPFFSGYIGKTLIHEGLSEYAKLSESFLLKGIECLYTLGGALTIAYMVKLCVVLFFEKNTNPLKQEQFDKIKKYMGVIPKVVLAIPALFFLITGGMPHVTLEKIINICYSDLRLAKVPLNVNYFHWTSLKFGILGVVFGVIIYFLFIRKWMMVEDEKGKKYIDRWNPKWDLEDRLYRPCLNGIITGFMVVCRLGDRLIDYVLIGLRKSIYRDSKLPHELDEGNLTTHMIGNLMDDGKSILNHTVYKKHPIAISYEHKLALFREELRENNGIIERSLSYGLFLFVGGLIITLIYMIV